MTLVKKGGVTVDKKPVPDGGAAEHMYKCPMDGGTRADPGPCPVCRMPLDERHKVPREGPKQERTIYVCDAHPEGVFDKPGRCFKDT